MNGKYTENIAISILSIGVVTAMSYALKTTESPLVLSNSVFSILAVCAVWVLLKKVVGILNKRLLVCSVILGALFAGMIIVGTDVYQGRIYGVKVNLLSILGLTPLLAAVSALVMKFYDQWIFSIKNSSIEHKIERIVSCIREKLHSVFCVTWIVLFLSWIPGLLATFPGVYGYDSIYQVDWFMKGWISGHHPILHTYLLGGCISIGDILFGSYEAGMLLYSIIQMIFLSFVFTYILKYIGRVLPRVIQLIVFILYAVVPYNVLFSFSATKDVIFAGLFALTVLKTYDMIINPKRFFGGWKESAAYVALILLMCAFRNNGYYAFLCLVPVLLFVCRQYWKKCLLICLAVLVCWNVYTGPVYAMLGVHQGRTAEMLSVPMQQLSYVMCDDPSKLTADEKKQITEYIPDYEKFDPSVSDYVKDRFNSDLFDEDPIEFIKLWLAVGIKYPVHYVDAFLRLNLGFWYPDMIYPDPGAWHPYIEYVNSSDEGEWILIERTSYIPQLSKFFEKFAYETIHQKLPFFSMLFQPGFTFWMICLGIMLCIYKQKYKMAVPFSIMIGLWLTLMLSPVVLLRYAYPLMISMPIVMCMCAETNDERHKKVLDIDGVSFEKL